MINQIALLPLFGKPLIIYAGAVTLLSFLLTAYAGWRSLDPKHGLPFRYHLFLARTSIALGLVHALFGLSLSFGF